ncbi:hypothetical protein [Paenibacillus amylolyticus]|nr:hypothetical protein [Paenibacillus amylolyticus]
MSNYMFPKETSFVSIPLISDESLFDAEMPTGILRNQKRTF